MTKTKWSKERHPSREGDRFYVRLMSPKMKGKRRSLGKPLLVEIKNGKIHFVLLKQVEFLSIGMPMRPDLGDVWSPKEKK